MGFLNLVKSSEQGSASKPGNIETSMLNQRGILGEGGGVEESLHEEPMVG